MTPQPAGYSGTPLARKLGITEGARVALLGAPPHLPELLAPLPGGTTTATRLAKGATFDVLLFFTTGRAELTGRLDRLRAAMKPAAGLWVCWPKKASKVPTDMTEDAVREIALPTGLVDNKVAAVDETWSGLRLVIRKELRAKA